MPISEYEYLFNLAFNRIYLTDIIHVILIGEIKHHRNNYGFEDIITSQSVMGIGILFFVVSMGLQGVIKDL